MHATVYTGDIVGSSRLEESRRRNLSGLMEEASEAVASAFGRESVPLPVDVFRGDSWQFYSPDVRAPVQIALFLKAWLFAQSEGDIRTRISIGLGRIDYPPPARASEGDGEAYRISGRGLEQMSRREMLALGVPERLGEHTAGLFTAAGRLIDHVSSQWTVKQCRALSAALSGKTQEETAAAWHPHPISQQAVAQHLKRAGWDHVQPAAEQIDAALAALLTEHGSDG